MSNKNRLGSTTCGEESQNYSRRCSKIDKVKKDFGKNHKNFSILSDFEFLTFFTFKMTLKFKFDLIRNLGVREISNFTFKDLPKLFLRL